MQHGLAELTIEPKLILPSRDALKSLGVQTQLYARLIWAFGTRIHMFLRRLQSIIYPTDGSPWFIETTKNPTWTDIDAAVRRLDRVRYPIVYLFENSEAPDDEIPEFTIIGGQDAYALGTEDLFYHDETKSDSEVQVWESDQGASFPDCYVCHKLEIVLRATRHLFETGKLDPAVEWKAFEDP